MKTFIQLHEAFSNPYPWAWKVKDDTNWIAIAREANLRIVIDKYRKTWELVFMINGKTRATGAGDQFRIFATVLEVTKDFIEKENPEEIMFTADKPEGNESRTKLYTRMVKKYLSKGYKVSTINEPGLYAGLLDPNVKFMITKK